MSSESSSSSETDDVLKEMTNFLKFLEKAADKTSGGNDKSTKKRKRTISKKNIIYEKSNWQNDIKVVLDSFQEAHTKLKPSQQCYDDLHKLLCKVIKTYI